MKYKLKHSTFVKIWARAGENAVFSITPSRGEADLSSLFCKAVNCGEQKSSHVGVSYVTSRDSGPASCTGFLSGSGVETCAQPLVSLVSRNESANRLTAIAGTPIATCTISYSFQIHFASQPRSPTNLVHVGVVGAGRAFRLRHPLFRCVISSGVWWSAALLLHLPPSFGLAHFFAAIINAQEKVARALGGISRV